MFALHVITLLFNGLTLAMALGLSLIVLWHDFRREQNQIFVLFLFFVMLWNVGSLLAQVSVLTVNEFLLVDIAVGVLQLGFVGSSISTYVLVTIMVGVHARVIRWLSLMSLVLIVGYQLFLIVIRSIIVEFRDIPSFQFQAVSIAFFAVFDGVSAFLLWRYRRKIRSHGTKIGIAVFLCGQGLTFVNPALTIAALSTSLGSVGALLVGFAVVRQEIIIPLAERISQVEAIHKVSLSVSSQIALDALLEEIAIQAVGWLNADGAGIFLGDVDAGGSLKLLAKCRLPKHFLGKEIQPGHGIVGTAVATRKSILVENYGRDWIGDDDLELARETFGSVICSPLNYGGRIMGALLVVAGRQGRLFDEQDVYRLELLGAQAVVAISHSQLFQKQAHLTREVEEAHRQLETVLRSTDNPVIAVNRQLKVVFVNPAAYSLFPFELDRPVTEFLPKEVFPKSLRTVLSVIRQGTGYNYEITINGKVYLCHLAALREPRIEGWVAVLNDITQLKELDRLKSEMVRMASHDLKNPLMGAMAYLELLREDIRDPENIDSEEVITTIERQLDRMNRIISGVLDVERIKAGKIAREYCYPAIMLKDVLGELEQFINDKNTHINVEVEENVPRFLGDNEKFKRVLINLIENAVKFSLPGGSVLVRIYKEDDNVVFSVSDNGVGIPTSIQPFIFDRFFRGQQKGVEHVTGSGLGLSLVKVIVESHAGKIWFVSEEGEGTTFYVSVPTEERYKRE